MEILDKVLNGFLTNSTDYIIQPFGTGLIHKTFIVEKNNEKMFVLQQINTNVFKWPDHISFNIHNLSDHLISIGSTTILPRPLKTISGMDYMENDGVLYRLMPFIKDTHSIDVCASPDQAYEAAKQFGNLTASFNHFNTDSLKTTIQDFHNLSFRWNKFTHAIKNGNPKRIEQCKSEINALISDYRLVEFYENAVRSGWLNARVTHHDTKISNVLFDSMDKGVCVIDLDTVMSGYFISDLGDMFRTYLSSANEEEQDVQMVIAREDYLKAILEGYKEKMADLMSDIESQNILYAGEFMIYMQALRFLTDYLNNDVYYSIHYETNNLTRTLNQLALLKSYRSIISL